MIGALAFGALCVALGAVGVAALAAWAIRLGFALVLGFKFRRY